MSNKQYDKNFLSLIIFVFFFRGHVGPLHKIQGYQGHRNVSNCRPHHNGDILISTTRGNHLKTSFSYTSQNVKQMYILGYLGGPDGVFNDRTVPAVISPISMYMPNK